MVMPSLDEMTRMIGVSPDDWYESWLMLEDVCQRAEQFMKQIGHEYAAASDATAKARYARQMEVLEESWCVLSAWTELIHATWVIATHGTHSIFFEGTRMTALSDAPEIVRKRYGRM